MKTCTSSALGSAPERVAQVLLAALALVLPFEAPLFHVGPLQLTTVELALYATLAAWGFFVAWGVVQAPSEVWRSAVDAVRRDALVQVALAWVAVLFVSAAVAPSNMGAGFKFALRSLSGVLAFFAARSLGRRHEVARVVVTLLLFGAVGSALTAWVDALVPGSASWFAPFRAGTFTALGLVRASGTFAYPTIAAMYWEAAVALAIAVPLFWSGGGVAATRRRAALGIGAAVILVWAIIDSATRSGLAGAIAASAAMLWLGWPLGAGPRRMATRVAGAVVALSLFAVVTPDPASLLSQRLRFWHDGAWLRVEFALDAAPRTAQVGEALRLPVTVRNAGTVAWTSASRPPIYLASHWEPAGRRATLAEYEGARNELPGEILPGASAEILGQVYAPATEGTYRLRWDLVQEGVTWFSEQGNPTGDQPFVVTSAPGGARELPAGEPLHRAPAPAMPPRPSLWRAALILWRAHPLFGIGPDNFRHSYQAVLSGPNGVVYTDTRVHANSLYFETLADLGLAGLASLGFTLVALVRALLAHRARGDLVGLAAGVGAGAFFMHGVLDYFFEFTPLFGLFWILLGLTAARASAGPERPAPSSTPS